METERPQPETKASKWLMEVLRAHPRGVPLDAPAVTVANLVNGVLPDIERQARHEVIERIRAGVAGLSGWRDPRYSGQYESVGLVGRSAVLSLLDDLDSTSVSEG